MAAVAWSGGPVMFHLPDTDNLPLLEDYARRRQIATPRRTVLACTIAGAAAGLLAALPYFPVGPLAFAYIGAVIGALLGLAFAFVWPRPKATLVGCIVVAIVVGLSAASPLLLSGIVSLPFRPSGLSIFGLALPGSAGVFIGLLFDD